MKKLHFFSMAVLFTAAMSVFFVACQKDETNTTATQVTTEAKVQVIDGVLHFVDHIEFNATIDKLKAMTFEQRLEWNKLNKFFSLAERLEHFNTDLDRAESKDAYQRIISENSDMVSVVDDLPTVKSPFRNLFSVLNKDGIVFIGNNLYSFTEKGEIIIKNGKLENLRDVIINPRNDEAKGYVYFPISHNGERAACGTLQTATFTNATLDRRGKVEAKTLVQYIIQSNNAYNITADSHVFAEAWKFNVFGNWVTYKTNNTLHNNYGVKAFNGLPVNSPNQNFNYTNYASGINYSWRHVNKFDL